jgi:hypothetical protein
MANKLIFKLAKSAAKKAGGNSDGSTFSPFDAIGHLINSAMAPSGSKSIKTRTKDLILTFPVLYSDSISLDTISTINKGLEVENACLIKLIIESDLGELAADVKKTTDVLNKFHTNVGLTNDSSLNNVNTITYMQSPITAYGLSDSYDITNEDLILASQRLSKSFDEKINEYSLNESTLPKILKEAEPSTSFEKEDKPFLDEKMMKKINDNQPLIIKGKLKIKKTDDEISEVPILFGIKNIAHPIQSSELVKNVGTTLKISGTSGLLTNLVRWRSGELKLFKDILFKVDEMKFKGTQAGKGNQFWFFKLQDLANDAKRRKLVNKPGNLNRVSTLVFSREDVDSINREYAFDLRNPRIAQSVLEKFFLFNIMIIDEANEKVYVYDESSRSYIVKKIKDFYNSKNKEIDMADLISVLSR